MWSSKREFVGRQEVITANIAYFKTCGADIASVAIELL